MNSVANGKIRQHTPFKNVFIQPAAGDNGTALGAALEAWQRAGRARSPRAWSIPTGAPSTTPTRSPR